MGYSSYSAKQKKPILPQYLEDMIRQALDSKSKILLFLNRKGFATFVSCHHCNIILKCPRCNINLVYYFKDNILRCHHCNFKMQAPVICPNCNSGYIRYSGIGTEKIESELARLFPQTKIKRLETAKELDINAADIFVATESIVKEAGCKFDLVTVLSIDNSLNRIDFRSAEKTFGLLVKLLRLTDKKIIIQTGLPNHHCFKALQNKDAGIFYTEELKQRKQLGFPPYKHMALVKLRGKNQAKVQKVSQALFERLKGVKANKSVKIVSVNPGNFPKLRGNFYWQILMKAGSCFAITRFMKIHLKNFLHSGIIVTVDIDPL